jgi:hypothetical protein
MSHQHVQWETLKINVSGVHIISSISAKGWNFKLNLCGVNIQLSKPDGHEILTETCYVCCSQLSCPIWHQHVQWETLNQLVWCHTNRRFVMHFPYFPRAFHPKWHALRFFVKRDSKSKQSCTKSCVYFVPRNLLYNIRGVWGDKKPKWKLMPSDLRTPPRKDPPYSTTNFHVRTIVIKPRPESIGIITEQLG